MSHTATERRPGTPLRVLVVEDSLFFRGQLVRLLQEDGDIVVVGEAGDGIDAIRKVQSLQPDLVTMDIEMPVMDGIAAVREIMRIAPTAIMMLSALTRLGADATFAALEAGAADFIPKQSLPGDGSAASARTLRERVRQLARGSLRIGPAPRAAAATLVPASFAEHSLLVIGASTGGPALVSELLDVASPDLPCAVLVVMHMPAGFTRYYAERTDRRCALTVTEASDGAELVPGRVWIAPGGSQTTIRRGVRFELEVREAASSDIYRPCIDLTLTSVARTFGSRALAVIATGMGADGAVGSRTLRAAGGGIWAQDEASCAVFGMPAAVINAGLADDVVSASELKRRLQLGR